MSNKKILDIVLDPEKKRGSNHTNKQYTLGPRLNFVTPNSKSILSNGINNNINSGMKSITAWGKSFLRIIRNDIKIHDFVLAKDVDGIHKAGYVINIQGSEYTVKLQNEVGKIIKTSEVAKTRGEINN